jgi:hypothetical protein
MNKNGFCLTQEGYQVENGHVLFWEVG